MKNASISQLREGLNTYIDLVKHGEIIVITDRELPVARIIPFVASAKEEDGRLDRLESSGIIKRASSKMPQEFLQRKRPGPVGGTGAVEALIQEREAGR